MKREKIIKLLKEKIKTKNLIKHMLATEVSMKALAEHFNGDQVSWARAGLVHDIDYETTKDNFKRHGLESAEILSKKGFSPEVIDAVKAHAGKKDPVTKMERALYAVDPLTGLIVAAALMHPDKKLKSLDADFVMRRFNEKRFATGADRDQIKSSEKLGLSLKKFIEITLEARKSIDRELGL
ncbi:MAG: HDIG domain-containing protein [Elusimicrobia bacterium]|jgi:putative nucleotidyltransferase with HDIG domain|nr:HDIG domain-containing protein [Elusimicrobiota bacterium]